MASSEVVQQPLRSSQTFRCHIFHVAFGLHQSFFGCVGDDLQTFDHSRTGIFDFGGTTTLDGSEYLRSYTVSPRVIKTLQYLHKYSISWGDKNTAVSSKT